MPFIPENELERALVKAAHDRAAAPDFYRLLLDCDLLVLGSAEGQEQATDAFSLEPGGKLSLLTGEKNGGRFLPVFSSLTRMQDYSRQGGKYLSINGRALLHLTRGGPVILNPASEYGKELTADQVRQLLEGPRHETRLILGAKEHPTALVALLTAVFASRPDVERAWMIQATFPDHGNEECALVGVELDSGKGGDWPSLMQAVQAAMETSGSKTVLDMERVDRRDPAAPSSKLLTAPAFYQRHSLN